MASPDCGFFFPASSRSTLTWMERPCAAASLALEPNDALTAERLLMTKFSRRAEPPLRSRWRRRSGHIGNLQRRKRARPQGSAPRRTAPFGTQGPETRPSYALFFGTFLPFLRAFDRPMAMACLRLFTLPPRPP